MGVDIFVRQAAGPDQKIEPARPTPLRRRLGSAQEIAFRHDTEELSIGIDDRQAADFMPQHQLHGLQDVASGPIEKTGHVMMCLTFIGLLLF